MTIFEILDNELERLNALREKGLPNKDAFILLSQERRDILALLQIYMDRYEEESSVMEYIEEENPDNECV